jgi:acyl carrier protein
MTRDEAFATFTAAAVDVLAVDADKVVPEASFADDLDADSLDLVEFVMALEEQFDVEIPESELEGVTTVAKAFELVCTKLGI